MGTIDFLIENELLLNGDEISNFLDQNEIENKNEIRKSFARFLAIQTRKVDVEKVHFSSEKMINLTTSISSLASSFSSTWEDLIKALPFEKLQSFINPNIVPKIEAMENLLINFKIDVDKFLEEKRASFARLHFLSNQEVLNLFANGNDSEAVQPFFEKLFEGIGRVEFDENSLIVSMISKLGERVPLADPISIKQSPDLWLADFEFSMKKTVNLAILKAYESFPSFENRIDWIKSNPAQASIVVTQIKYAEAVESAIANQSLPEVLQDINNQLSELTKETLKDLNAKERMTIQNIIIISVHNRDLLAEMIEKSNPLLWQSQLRFYLEYQQVVVRMMTSENEYGNEYLGNYSQLVITPLTDRAYRTIINAKQHFFGAAPQGPAGTGKTETTRDLARALGKNCVVINSSDQLDEKNCAEIFKGAIASGSWVCFDEFNRIHNEVLVNVGEQLKMIKDHRERGAERIEDFCGTKNVKLCKDSFIAVTMNPGYAGRTELPDNLKPYFRPISMMVPDYALIAEIMLYSSGYQTADVLGKKLTLVHKLCSEQLSAQDHYDYGMRAVKHSVTHAKSLKLLYPDLDETTLLADALRSLHFSKLVEGDFPLFGNIMNDVFPGHQALDRDYDEFERVASEVCASRGLQATEDFIARLVLTYRALRDRHGIMIIGKSGTGKTTLLSVLQETLSSLNMKDHVQDGQKVQAVDSEIIFIKTMTCTELYGYLDPISKKWNEGKLTETFRKFSEEQNDGRQKWMIFDGPVDAIWVENLNQVLDDNKKLPLANGDVIPATENMRFIFNVQDVKCASPATISRCGMIQMSEQFVDPLKTNIGDHTIEKILKKVKQEQKNLIFESRSQLKEQIINAIDTKVHVLTPSSTREQMKEILAESAGPDGIVIIDNLNHPSKECYGAQPPLELLREYLDNNMPKRFIAFYDRQGLTTSPALLRHFDIMEDISTIIKQEYLNLEKLKVKLNEQRTNLKGEILKAIDIDFLKNKSFFAQMTEEDEFYYSSLIFSLCVFHAVVTERANHVPHGWNIAYAFKQEDLVISLEQLESLSLNFKENNLIKQLQHVEMLRYLIGECNYGGRITDDKDRRLCNAILEDFLFADLGNFKFQVSRDFFTDLNSEQKARALDEILAGTSELSLLGLSESAIRGQPLCSAKNIFEGLTAFDHYLRNVEFSPVSTDSPFSTFVASEQERYKKLVERLLSQLEDLAKAVNGKILFRESHRRALASLAAGELPQDWKRISFARSAENKNFEDFLGDLKDRIEFINNWAEKGELKSYDLSKMFFQQAFFTAVLQTFARAKSVSIDEVGFDFQMLTPYEPKEGVMVSGLFVVGASFDIGKQHLILNNGSIFNFPEIWLKPVLKSDLPKDGSFYDCPVYKTPERKGVLSTTGHSINFLMMMRIPIPADENASSFVKRGVALLCSKN
ncbi:Oidioi.mRNA.OKI2018_I69.chr2.g5148.t1.cds [Oikopleura dioica]|uniref:Oidioi.mRNA.OKI2018_I69.chr2.g5148.t1.cds n=1 Tax=Oikopleura dioica TaxID=34765 RepID=A0ABN7T661_OIKDI|nr:Oidioi.mRNA.OKI2018_I69.chr2.g5148.t1.cds [Oikopleura dioica]